MVFDQPSRSRSVRAGFRLVKDSKRTGQSARKRSLRTALAGRELLQGQRLLETATEPGDHQLTSSGVESIKPGLEPGRQAERPETLETEPGILETDDRSLGTSPGSASFQKCQLLVGLQGDSTIQTRFDLTPCRGIEVTERLPHHAEAEAQPVAELRRGQRGDRSGEMLLDPENGGREDRFTHTATQGVGAAQTRLDFVEATDRRRSREHVDEPGGDSQLQVHGGQYQVLG